MRNIRKNWYNEFSQRAPTIFQENTPLNESTIKLKFLRFK